MARLKLRHKGFRFGVRGSLFAAFAVIAGMAIVISAGAGLMLFCVRSRAAVEMPGCQTSWA